MPYATLSIFILLFFILCFILFFSTCPLYICNSCIFVYVYVYYIYIYIFDLYLSVFLRSTVSVICMHQGVRE